MILVSLLSNIAGYAASKVIVKGVINATGSKYGVDILDKVLVPIGVEIMCWAAGDAAQEYVENKTGQVKAICGTAKELREEKMAERRQEVKEDE